MNAKFIKTRAIYTFKYEAKYSVIRFFQEVFNEITTLQDYILDKERPLHKLQRELKNKLPKVE